MKPSAEAAMRALKLARGWLKRANDSSILGYKDLAVVASFISMLHAARAIMRRDGVREKDDRGMIEYVKKRYPELKEHMASLDQYRGLVLAIQRDPEVSVGGSDSKGAMNSANELIKSVDGLLSK